MSDATFEQWRALVEKGLKGAPFESLTATTLEGIPIAPLYAEQDRPAAEGIPWAPRAKRAIGVAHREVPDLRREAAAGATLAWVRSPLGIPVDSDIDVIVESHLEDAIDAAGARVRVLGDAFVDVSTSGTEPGPLLDRIARALERGAPALGVSACALDEVGAGAVTQLAGITAGLVASLRAMEERSVDLESAVERTTIALSVGTDLFLEIAKVRAARRLVARVLASTGIAARPWIAARTSERVHAELDRPTNLLRETLGIAAALIGGADAIAARPHAAGDAALRTARNAPLVLSLESHLAATADPAGGSSYVEHETAALASAAWELFAAVERAGGMTTGRSIVWDRAGDEGSRRTKGIVTRRAPIVGVSRFPVPGEAPSPGAGPRDAAPFELLRSRGASAVARCVVLGACPEARVEFAREVAQLAAQRVDVVNEVEAGDASFVILCAADAELATALPAAARALRAAGVRAIAVAGKPGANEQALRDAGVDAFVFVGADVVAALGALLDRGGKGA